MLRADAGKLTGLAAATLLTLALGASRAAAAGFERVDDFAGADNPGSIDMYRYVPAATSASPALLVLLHGCGQSAEDFGDSGWFELAERSGAVLLLPQQRRRNSLARCWNWFIGADGADNPEMTSILAMIARMRGDYPIDPGRIYLAGLSAGGWMTGMLLAAHPALFEAGAIIAGGPAYCAFNRRPWWDPFGWSVALWAWPAAFDCMDGVDLKPAQWAARVVANTGASRLPGLPRLSVWHGSDDDKVDPANLGELAEQWLALTGADAEADGAGGPDLPPGALRRAYAGPGGAERLETVLIDGMEHVMPIDGAAGCGRSSRYVDDLGICAAALIGRFWQLPGAWPPAAPAPR